MSTTELIAICQKCCKPADDECDAAGHPYSYVEAPSCRRCGGLGYYLEDTDDPQTLRRYRCNCEGE